MVGKITATASLQRQLRFRIGSGLWLLQHGKPIAVESPFVTAEVHDMRMLLITHQQEALARRGILSERSLGFSRALFEHAQDYRDIYHALVGERGATIMIARVRALLTELVRQEFSQIAPATAKSEIPRSALIQFVVGSPMSILMWWLELKPSLHASAVDAIFRQLTIPAIDAALGSGARKNLLRRKSSAFARLARADFSSNH